MGNCCSRENNNNPESNANKSEGAASMKDDNMAGPSPQNSTTPPRTAPPSASPNHSSKPSKSAPVGPVLGHPMEDIKSTYTIGKELGRGQFGVTHLCTLKATGEQFALANIGELQLHEV